MKSGGSTQQGQRCPSCGKKSILTDDNSGEVFCGKCGFVITEKIADVGAEWRSFSGDTWVCQR